MKKLTQISCLLLAAMFAFAGCDAAKKAATDAKDKAGEMANVDFGDFDMDGLKGKFTDITSGLKDVTADNVDGLTSKISDLSGSMDDMKLDKLPGAAKTAVTTAISKFGDTVKAAMENISDDSILAKLKPVVETLMEKINAMK
jgi:glucose dehydrogenase